MALSKFILKAFEIFFYLNFIILVISLIESLYNLDFEPCVTDRYIDPYKASSIIKGSNRSSVNGEASCFIYVFKDTFTKMVHQEVVKKNQNQIDQEMKDKGFLKHRYMLLRHFEHETTLSCYISTRILSLIFMILLFVNFKSIDSFIKKRNWSECYWILFFLIVFITNFLLLHVFTINNLWIGKFILIGTNEIPAIIQIFNYLNYLLINFLMIRLIQEIRTVIEGKTTKVIYDQV